MAIDFLTDPGGLFPRIGRILHLSYLVSPFEESLPAEFNAIFNQYLTSLEAVGGSVEIQAPSLTVAPSGVMGFASSTAQQTVIGMVFEDQPSQSRTLQAALTEVIRQMNLALITVEANVITITPTVLTGSVGTGVLVTATERGDGLVNENAVPETLRLVCTSDSYTGNATRGQEQFGLTGAPGPGGTWDYTFPTGSGASTSLAAVSPDQEADLSGNLLTNGSFEAWSGTSPGPTATLDNWTLEAGVWGTDIQQNATDPNGGVYCVEFLPTATAVELYQEFGDFSDGTSVVPDGLRSYPLNLWLRSLTGSISGGVLEVELIDDADVITEDAQGIPNTFSVVLSGLTTSYVAYSAVFRLNATPPDVIRLRFRISTPLEGDSFLMDSACYTPATGFYPGGPGFAVFSNPAVPFVGGDGWNIEVTNDYGGSSYLATFQAGFNRLFPMTSFGLLLPSDTPGTIPNSLITS